MEQLFLVQGMTCGHCERSVTLAIKQLDPKAEVAIDRPAGQVRVSSEQARPALAQAIAAEGYTVSP